MNISNRLIIGSTLIFIIINACSTKKKHEPIYNNNLEELEIPSNSSIYRKFIYKSKKGDTLMHRSYNAEDNISYEVIFSLSKDTLSVYENNIFRDYSTQDNLTKLISIYTLNQKIREHEGIFFDSTGRIQKINSDLSFLTVKDTQRLDKDYPNCRTEAKNFIPKP